MMMMLFMFMNLKFHLQTNAYTAGYDNSQTLHHTHPYPYHTSTALPTTFQLPVDFTLKYLTLEEATKTRAKKAVCRYSVVIQCDSYSHYRPIGAQLTCSVLILHQPGPIVSQLVLTVRSSARRDHVYSYFLLHAVIFLASLHGQLLAC